ncbi:MAG: VOC family protein [Phycisphaeraceae bacterium]|nr:VOC family protein [Phycisphaeraceae bacterium]
MPPFRLLETAIHVADVAASREWYGRVFGLRPLNPDNKDERLSALGLPGAQVLLIFKKGGSTSTLTFAGGSIPPHDAQGTTHFAFAIPEADLTAWRTHLASLRISIESEMNWERGGTSLYFRDLDGHLLELATPGVWPTY